MYARTGFLLATLAKKNVRYANAFILNRRIKTTQPISIILTHGERNCELRVYIRVVSMACTTD